MCGQTLGQTFLASERLHSGEKQDPSNPPSISTLFSEVNPAPHRRSAKVCRGVSAPFGWPSGQGLTRPVLDKTTCKSCSASQSQFNAFLEASPGIVGGVLKTSQRERWSFFVRRNVGAERSHRSVAPRQAHNTLGLQPPPEMVVGVGLGGPTTF